ncbi:MAG: glycosyltransferase family 4 protein [Deltaproteobacteria bacterium]|nr:glycosyltransferase family 4 protein [Deltaproteobacteria bacterium]
MRLLLVNEYFTPHAPGGAERSSRLLALALAGRGHEVVVATTGFGSAPSPDEDEHDRELHVAGVRVERMRLARRRPGDDRALPSYAFGNPIFHRRFARWIDEVANQRRTDLIHAHGYDAMAAAGRVRSSAPRVSTIRDYRALCPISICLHDQNRAPVACGRADFFRCCGLYRETYDVTLGASARVRHDIRRSLEWVNHAAAADALRGMDGAIFVSQRVRDIFRDAAVAPVRTTTIPNLPPATAGQTTPWAGDLRIEGRRIVLFVGRYSLGKGAAVISAAMSIVARRFPEALCVVAGRREYEGEGPAMIFLGQIESSKLAALYRDADVVVLPSRWQEPFSRVLLEAMSAARSVVATDSGGNAEAVIDGVTGRLVPRNDPAALADGICAVLALSADERRRMGEAGKELLAEKFSAESVLDRHEAFYREVMGA